MPPTTPVLQDPAPAWPDGLACPQQVRLAALSLFPEIGPASHELVARWCGAGGEAGWPAFAAHLARLDLAVPVRADALVLGARWRPLAARELAHLGGDLSVRSRLLEAWLADPDPRLLDSMTAWAAGMGRWDAMERIWILIAERTVGLPRSTLALFDALPEEARRAHPILTWASGVAGSLLGRVPAEQQGALWRRLLLDSALLHADWAVRKDTDEAVTAGTFRMIGERRLPAQANQALDAAWRTKEAVDELIDVRSRAGAGPSRTPQAVFRAFSARLALFRGDPHTAVDEARWSAVLSDWEPVGVLAKGVEALAIAITSEDGPAHFSEPPVAGIGDGLGARGLRGMGELYEILADGHEAVRRLDRDGVDRCLGLAGAEAATIAGVWAVRVSLEAWRSALWGDPHAGMAALSEEVSRFSLDGREDAEPMGGVLLRRAQAFLLAKAGAFGSATELAEALPEPVRLVVLARLHLWAGQYRQAIWLSDQGPHKPGLEIVQRYRLALIRVAAAVLDQGMTEELRRDAVRAVVRLVRTRSFLYLALLPMPARTALLELAAPELGDDPGLALLRERLQELNDDDREAARPFHLTDRERVLLPLLAGDDPVPAIARRLSVSPNTIRKQVVTLREKFGAATRAELVLRARTFGAIS